MTKEIQKIVADANNLKESDVSEAIDFVYEKACDVETSYTLWMLCGSYNFEAKNWDEAIYAFEEASNIRPDSELASIGIYHCYEQLGDEEKAGEEKFRYTKMYKSELYNAL